MDKIRQSIIFVSIVVVLMFGADIISAQTQDQGSENVSDSTVSIEAGEIPNEIQVIIDEDENITADDLEIKEPALLPGNPFYFVKNIGRGLKSAITFNQVKKAELKLRFANERLIELKKIAESSDNPKLLEKVMDKYEKELGKIEKITEKIKEEDDEKTEKFIDKFIDNQIKHQKLLGKIEQKAPQEILDKIQENRQIALKTLSNVPLMLISAERFQEKIENTIEKQPGSDFKNFKNLEILKELENKVPDTAKDAIKHARENTINRLREKMEENEQTAERIYTYIKIKNIEGDIKKHLEIINELDAQHVSPELKNTLEKAREITIERMEEKSAASQESAKEQINEAASSLEKAKSVLEAAKINLAINEKLTSASTLIKNTQIHLEKAKTAYSEEKFGEAFGQANLAVHNAINAIKIITRLKANENNIKDESDDEGENNNEDFNKNDDKNDADDSVKNNNATTTIIKKEKQLCAQVITPAKNQKTGECRKFPDACLPQGWYKVRSCEKDQTDSIDTSRETDEKMTE